LYEYNYLQRDVYEQVFDLDSLDKIRIINYLEENYKPENRAYAYDFFYDNCATRLWDVIVYGGDQKLQWKFDNASHKTFRQIIKEYQSVMPWLDFGVDLIIGAKADKIATLSEEVFIPDYLMNAVTDANLITETGVKKLVNEVKQVLSFQNENKGNFLKTIFHPWAIFSILLLLVLFSLIKPQMISRKMIKIFDKSWLLLMVLGGILMLVMWFGTDHLATRLNWNVLWANPLLALLLVDRISTLVSRSVSYVVLLLIGISIINAIPGIQILPQYFNPLFIPICLITCLVIYRNFPVTSSGT